MKKIRKIRILDLWYSLTERCSKVLQSFVHLPVFRP